MQNKLKKKGEIDLLDLISILLKNKLWIISITLLFMITIVTISIISLKLPPQKSFLPNEYSPKSLVMINSSGSNNSFDSLLSSSVMGSFASLAGISGSSSTSDSDLAIKLATTNSFINKLDQHFKLNEIYDVNKTEFPLTTLRTIVKKKLSIKMTETSGILEITYVDIDKKLATNIVNKVTELLENEFAIIDVIRNRNQYSVVEDKKAVVEAEMKRLQDEIINFQIKHNILDVRIVSEEIVKLISELQSDLLKKEVAIESYGKISNIKDPAYLTLVNQRDAILNAIGKLENGEVGDYPPIKDIPNLAVELETLKRKLDVQVISYKALIQQSETLKLTAEGTGPTFQVLETAEIPEMKSGPSRGKMCMIVSIIGFFFSIFFVFSKQLFIYIKNNPEIISRLKGVS